MSSTYLRRSLLSLPRNGFSQKRAFQKINGTRFLQSQAPEIESKYKDKIARAAREKGLSVDEIKAKAKEERTKNLQRQKEELALQKERDTSAASSQTPTEGSADAADAFTSTRKDSSPVKSLSSFFNLPRLMSTPHTAEQITALWSAYHASKSNGTGRGYLYASIPVDKYNQLLKVAKKYPSFIVPIARPPADADASQSPATPSESPYEFFYLQWDLHEPPHVPSGKSEVDQLFEPRPTSGDSPNPSLSTVLLTPLQEYKLRQAFATPYLVITHYTDLAHSHGIVLLRGEITPSSGTVPGADPADGGRFMLSQFDAQALALSVQKFYLWGNTAGEEGKGSELLKTFYEQPENFKWEDLLAYVKSTTV